MREHPLDQRRLGRLLYFLYRHCDNRWEVLLFQLICTLLGMQIYFFNIDIRSIASLNGLVSSFAVFNVFVVNHLSHLTIPLTGLPLLYLLFSPSQPKWARRFLDFLGIYVIFRWSVQLMGMNILVFDSVTPRFLLITQLLFFLPYSLLVWGWIYWRLDKDTNAGTRKLFRVDCETENPRPVDYLIASFSSVFSASISNIKGNCARARILILLHGFVIYDVMGLTFSRAVALVQGRQ